MDDASIEAELIRRIGLGELSDSMSSMPVTHARCFPMHSSFERPHDCGRGPSGCLRENLENGVEIQSQALPAIQLGRSGNQAALYRPSETHEAGVHSRGPDDIAIQ